MTQENLTIRLDFQRLLAQRIEAQTSKSQSSHLPFFSHPQEVAKLTEKVATASSSQLEFRSQPPAYFPLASA